MGLEPDKVLKSQIDAMAATIHGRHMMVGLLLGLPVEVMPDETKVKAEALAWLRFQQEWPKAKLSPRADVILGLAAASCASYLPLAAVLVIKAQQSKAASKAKTGPFAFGGAKPAAPGVAPNGHDPTVQPATVGNETVILSGVPDSGTLKFN